MSIDWAAINSKLPTGRSEEEKEQRQALFKQFDNGNGFLSLAEIDKSIGNLLQLDDVFDIKPAIMRAFQLAKSVVKSSKKSGDDFIEWCEFRYFLLSLRQYLEYYEAFERIDSDSNHQISLTEFKQAQEKIEKWVGPISPEDEFNAIDKNGGGSILFDEFCDWAIKKSLDLEDDVD
ncbi:flagellar calcium-binding protein TB-44A [Hydra vulgaris]|uniref:flagellar calcium-binding protein TB-44A n=1 Tax=Hydra vulgaris TaxID=6087 RepID=UPI00019272C6|nr:flagellar calcium-binding protein TB-44A [Hydra vulgaris]